MAALAERPALAQPEYLTLTEVAFLLRSNERTVRRMVAKGQIPQPARFGRHVRWPRERIERFMDGDTSNGGAES